MVKPCVHVRLKGRLGNQLFQFWIAKYVSMCTGLPLSVFSFNEFYLDAKTFPNAHRPSFKLLQNIVTIPQRRQLADPSSVEHCGTICGL